MAASHRLGILIFVPLVAASSRRERAVSFKKIAAR